MTVVPLDERRALTIGGSEAAAACGVDPYRSAVMLWAEKTGRIEREPSEAMAWGTRLEPVVFAAVAEQYEVMPAPADGFADGWRTGHPNGFVVENDERGILEIKTAGAWMGHDWNGGAPLAYIVQCHHYMQLTGDSFALLACLVGGQRLELRRVERDEKVLARMIELEEEFYESLRSDSPPAPDGSGSAGRALRALFAEGSGRVCRLDSEHWRVKREAAALREQRDTIDRQLAERIQTLQAFMGDAETAISPHDEPAVSWTSGTRKHFDIKAFRADHPHLADEYTVSNPQRRFELK